MDRRHTSLIAIALGAAILAFQGGARAATTVKLFPPSPEEVAVFAKATNDKRAPRIGFARSVNELADERLASQLQWQESAGGGLRAQVAITSPEAAAIRVGIVAKALPLQARLRFHDGSSRPVEVKGEDILERIAANLDHGDTGANARTYWSPVIESSTAMIEIELPAGTRAAEVRMSMPVISHLLSSAKKGFTLPKVETSCAVDAKCHENMWGSEMNAEARILYTRDGTTYACSGTLLADHDPNSQIPYFHTASHCIKSQSDASTVATYWFYRSSSCNSGAAGRFEVRSAGAELLHVHAETDTTLLRLNEAPPAGAVYMGWNAASPLGIGAAVTGIHHGDAEQKLSFGDVRAFAGCLMQGGMCMAESLGGGNYYYVTWRAGVTLAGSSGSPLVADNSRSLVGHLSSGMSACGPNPPGDFYGRFDVAYRAGLNRWLGAAPVAVVTPVPTPPPPPREMIGPRLRLTTTLGQGGAQRALN